MKKVLPVIFFISLIIASVLIISFGILQVKEYLDKKSPVYILIDKSVCQRGTPV